MTGKKATAKKPTAKNPTAKNPTAKKPTAKKPPSTKSTEKSAPAKRVQEKAQPKKAANPLEDASLKARWQEAIDRFERSRGQEATGWDEMYEALGDIFESDPPLYLAGGYKDDHAFVAARLPGLSVETVWSYIRVARYFDPEDEQQHGASKLDLLVQYLNVKGKLPLAGTKLKPESARVVREDGKTALFPELSYDELRSALRAAKDEAGREAPKESPIIKQVRRGLEAAKARGIGVRLRASKLDLTGIPLEKLAAVGHALVALKLDLK